MFEECKDKAKKTTRKKEKHTDEITTLLTKEIMPKLACSKNAKTKPRRQWERKKSMLMRSTSI